MLKIYLYHINEAKLDAKREQALGLLPSWRVEKYKRIIPQKGKYLALGAGLLLRHALRDAAGIELLTANIGKGDQGKPYLIDHPDLYFNLSHAGSEVAAAVGDMPVGIDVETRTDPGHGVAEHVFSAEELDELRGAKDPDREFTILWTRKEAYVKCTGTGITIPLNSFSVLEDCLGEYRLKTLQAKKEYALSACVRSSSLSQEEFPNFTLDIIDDFDI